MINTSFQKFNAGKVRQSISYVHQLNRSVSTFIINIIMGLFLLSVRHLINVIEIFLVLIAEVKKIIAYLQLSYSILFTFVKLFVYQISNVANTNLKLKI